MPKWPANFRAMKRLFFAWALLCSLNLIALGQPKIELQPGDTMQSMLERNVGQVVDLRLKSGEKIGGKVEKVTEDLAHLSQLTGAEFYEAVIDLKEIAAISVRSKAK